MRGTRTQAVWCPGGHSFPRFGRRTRGPLPLQARALLVCRSPVGSVVGASLGQEHTLHSFASLNFRNGEATPMPLAREGTWWRGWSGRRSGLSGLQLKSFASAISVEDVSPRTRHLTGRLPAMSALGEAPLPGQVGCVGMGRMRHRTLHAWLPSC